MVGDSNRSNWNKSGDLMNSDTACAAVCLTDATSCRHSHTTVSITTMMSAVLMSEPVVVAFCRHSHATLSITTMTSAVLMTEPFADRSCRNSNSVHSDTL